MAYVTTCTRVTTTKKRRRRPVQSWGSNPELKRTVGAAVNTTGSFLCKGFEMSDPTMLVTSVPGTVSDATPDAKNRSRLSPQIVSPDDLRAYRARIDQHIHGPLQRGILLLLIDWAKRPPTRLMGQRAIATALSTTRRTVQRTINVLEQRGWFRREPVTAPSGFLIGVRYILLDAEEATR